MLQWFDATVGMRSVSLRYFNAAGASSDGKIGEDFAITQNLVPVLMKALLGKRPPLEVYGTDYPTPDGTAVRDYIHVEDLAEAHVLALEYLDRGGATTALNLGTGKGSSVREVLDAARRITGQEVPVTIAPRRAGDPEILVADTSARRWSCSAGSRSWGSTTSSPRPGSGTRRTLTGSVEDERGV